MKVAITGAAGQLGRALRLTQPDNVQVSYLERGQFDLTVSPLPLIDADVVINAAAYTAVDRAETEPDLAWAVNATAPGELARRVAEAGGRLIHVSTDYVFGHASAAAGPIPADAAPSPVSVYGRSKLAGEAAATQAGAIVVRTAWVYSGDLLPQCADFVSTMLRLAREGAAPRVVADQVGSPTYAPDLARVLWRLAVGEEGPANPAPGSGRVCHAVGAGSASWYELACEVFAAAGRPASAVTPITTEEWPTPAPRPAWSVLRSDFELPEWRSGVARAVAGRL